jgi:hypothetical protein
VLRANNQVNGSKTYICKLKARLGNPKEAQIYRQLYNDTYMNLYDKVSGSWWDALSFVNSMDTHSRQSLYEYISKANS